jgi:low affinity Fe/Cu permease
MQTKKKTHEASLSERFAISVTKATGSTAAFILAFFVVLVWAVSGPFFHYSENWQLVINTGTTIITFLMVFLIQKAQNKDSLAIQLKLNELVAAHEFASNRLVNVENMSEEDLKVIQKYYAGFSSLTKKEESLQQSHSIMRLKIWHRLKRKGGRYRSDDPEDKYLTLYSVSYCFTSLRVKVLRQNVLALVWSLVLILRPKQWGYRRIKMKITTYNVNGVNGRLPSCSDGWKKPDIVCLRTQVAGWGTGESNTGCRIPGRMAWTKSWNCVAVLSRVGNPVRFGGDFP